MTTNERDKLTRLGDFFPSDDIEWKTGVATKDGKRALAMAYVTNRAIMDRLDDVVGAANWKNEFVPGPDGGVLCGLSLRIDGEWVTKWDGAENTDFEAVKGGLSGAMKRAAVQWGIGRYLYDLPTQWVALDERGRFIKTPTIPQAFLPRRLDERPAHTLRPVRNGQPAPVPEASVPPARRQQRFRRAAPADDLPF